MRSSGDKCSSGGKSSSGGMRASLNGGTVRAPAAVPMHEHRRGSNLEAAVAARTAVAATAAVAA